MVPLPILALARPDLFVYALPLALALPRGDYLPFGLNPTVLVLGLLLMAILLKSVTGDVPKNSIFHPLLIPLGLVIGVVVVHAIVYGGESVELLTNMGSALPAFIIGLWIAHDKNSIRHFGLAVDVSGVLLMTGVLITTLASLQDSSIVENSAYLVLRSWELNPFYGGSGNWMSVAIIPVAFAVVRIFRGEGSFVRSAFAYYTVASFFLLSTLQNARAGWLVLLIAFLFVFRMKSTRNTSSTVRTLVATAVLAGIALILISIYSDAAVHISSRLGELFASDRFLNRTYIWPEAINRILQAPITGNSVATGQAYFAHNAYLDFAIIFGIPFALMLAIALVIITLNSFRALANLDEQAHPLVTMGMAVGVWLSLLFNMAVPSFIGDPFFNAFFWVCAAILCMVSGRAAPRPGLR
ncbi:MAG: O-antigen ligase family protein [Anaerolineae bacterium]|nr:O-antigen ligase family protein [Anaerolineae bacterium]